MEVLTESDQGLMLQASYSGDQTLTSPLLEGLAIGLDEIFRR